MGDSGGESPTLELAKVGSPSSRSPQGQYSLPCKFVVKIRDNTWGAPARSRCSIDANYITGGDMD